MSHDECQKELEQLKERLAVLIPIVREQKRAASRRADNDYFAEKDIPPRWDFSSPEQRELHSIGLAVAAFGGSDAIEELGRGWADGREFLWRFWDGIAHFCR